MKVAVPTSVGADQYCYQSFDVYEPGTYTFSAYVKTQTVIGNGAYIKAVASSDGIVCDNEVKIVTGTTNSYANNGWQRLQVTVSLDAFENIGHMVVSIGILSGTSGTAYFDCMQVEKSETANPYNMIGNSGFESSQDWTAVNCSTGDGRSTEDSISGRYSYKISGKQDQNSYIMQTVDVSSLDFTQDQIYSFIVSGWGKASSASYIEKSAACNSVEVSQKPVFGILVKCLYDDNSLQDVADMVFDDSSRDWQFGSSAISLQAYEEEGNTYVPEKLVIYCTYAYNVNSAYFDNIQLMAGSNITYSYDENGNMIAAVSSDGSSTNLTYNENNDITSITGSDGINSFYGYGGASQHDLLHSYSLGTTQDTVYDTYGNVTQETVKQSKITDSGIYFITSANLTTVVEGDTYPIALDVYYGMVGEGVSMISWNEHNDINQQFHIRATDDTNQYFVISPVSAPWMYISLYEDEVAIISSTATEWKIELAGAGTYRLIPRSDETKCLTLSSQRGDVALLEDISENDPGSYFTFRMLTAEESMVTYYTGNPSINYGNHVLKSDPIKMNRTYYFRCENTNKFAEVYGGTIGQGSRITLSSYNGLSKQRFKLVSVSGTADLVYIAAESNVNMVWTSVNGNIQLMPNTGADNQKWQIIQDENTSRCGILLYDEDAEEEEGVSYDSMISDYLFLDHLETLFYLYRCDASEDMLEMTTSSAYTSDSQYVASTTDERGNTEQYTYAADTGDLTSYTDKAGLTYYYDGNQIYYTDVYADLDDNGDYYNDDLDDFDPYVTYYNTGDRLTKIETYSGNYLFSYNNNGSLAQIKLGNQSLMSYTYGNSQRGNLERVTYGNGDYYEYTYDVKGNIVRVDCVSGNSSHYYTYTYDNNGNVTSIYDSQRNVTTTCSYDASGNIYGTESSDGKTIYQQLNGDNQSASIRYSWKGHTETYQFTYTDEGELTSVTLPDGSVESSESDVFGRLETTEITAGAISMTTAYQWN